MGWSHISPSSVSDMCYLDKEGFVDVLVGQFL